MKTLLVIGGFLLLIAAACAAPHILGGPTPETTTTKCDDGTTCPNPYVCAPLAGGNCEAPSDVPNHWGQEGVRLGDAGR